MFHSTSGLKALPFNGVVVSAWEADGLGQQPSLHRTQWGFNPSSIRIALQTLEALF